jgi:hypothetical protein
MNRYGFALAVILAASPVCAAKVTTCHTRAERYGMRAMNLRECPAGPQERICQPGPRTRRRPNLRRLRAVSVALNAKNMNRH